MSNTPPNMAQPTADAYLNGIREELNNLGHSPNYERVHELFNLLDARLTRGDQLPRAWDHNPRLNKA